MLAICSAEQLQETKNIGGATDITEGRVLGLDFATVDNHDSDNKSFRDRVRKAVFNRE